VPSPRNTNFERLFMLRVPEGTDPKLALDAAMRAKDRKYGRDGDPDQDENLGRFRQKLEYFLSQCLKDEQYAAAMDLLNEHLPGGTVYGEAGTEDADDPNEVAESLRSKQPDHAQDDRERMRRYMEDRGCSDAEIQSVLNEMPRSAIEDRRRSGGRDRRRGAMDRAMTAADSFEAMYGTSRIKSTNSFR
jgi:hypothetical protein